jgi:hypothetical protein
MSKHKLFPPTPVDDDQCDVCGLNLSECRCRICPNCAKVGDPGCYDKRKCGGLVGITPKGTPPRKKNGWW